MDDPWAVAAACSPQRPPEARRTAGGGQCRALPAVHGLLLVAAVKRSRRLRHVWVDLGYRDGFAALLARHHYNVTVEVVARPREQRGGQLLPRRWVVERRFAWLGRFRRM